MPEVPKRDRVLCLLQNQWFKDPDRMETLLKKYQEHEGGYWEGRARFVRDMLFMGCLTGQRLEKAFGEGLCSYGGLIFEEVSLSMGNSPSSVFPPDKEHVVEVLRYHKPGMLVTFGKVAAQALTIPEVFKEIVKGRVKVLKCRHPAARGYKSLWELDEAAKEVKLWLSTKKVGGAS